jgi:hypothetical protein
MDIAMNIETVRSFFLWCTVINYAVLLLWVVIFWFVHDWHYRLTNRFFKVSVETYDLVNFSGIAAFKIAIILLNLVPFLALCIIDR